MKTKMKVLRAQSRFEDSFVPVPEAGCWIWTSDRSPARRTSWLLSRGVKPPRHPIRETCGNAFCVNPDHLRAD